MSHCRRDNYMENIPLNWLRTTPWWWRGKWRYSSTILNVSIKQGWVVNFMLWPLYAWYLPNKRLGGVPEPIWMPWRRENLLPLPGIKPLIPWSTSLEALSLQWLNYFASYCIKSTLYTVVHHTLLRQTYGKNSHVCMFKFPTSMWIPEM
jgi:hypothetical protein